MQKGNKRELKQDDLLTLMKQPLTRPSMYKILPGVCSILRYLMLKACNATIF